MIITIVTKLVNKPVCAGAERKYNVSSLVTTSVWYFWLAGHNLCGVAASLRSRPLRSLLASLKPHSAQTSLRSNLTPLTPHSAQTSLRSNLTPLKPHPAHTSLRSHLTPLTLHSDHTSLRSHLTPITPQFDHLTPITPPPYLGYFFHNPCDLCVNPLHPCILVGRVLPVLLNFRAVPRRH